MNLLLFKMYRRTSKVNSYFQIKYSKVNCKVIKERKEIKEVGKRRIVAQHDFNKVRVSFKISDIVAVWQIS